MSGNTNETCMLGDLHRIKCGIDEVGVNTHLINTIDNILPSRDWTRTVRLRTFTRTQPIPKLAKSEQVTTCQQQT